VPKDSTNLCYRSAKLLQDTFKIESGLDIKIIKRIPVGAGLGGGSSDAASVLLGLNRLWKLNLSQKKIAEYAAKLGSDIPFFICNIPFARGEGRGEKIKPLGGLRDVRLDHILVVPKIKVSTPLIYRKWDRFSKLTVPNYDDKILNLALRKKGLIQRPDLLFNGLEEVTTRLYPQLKRIKEKLMQLGLKSILMSGSGPAIFGIVSSKKEAVSLRRKLRKVNKSWRVFVTRTF
jgi:4-diphosphocytidyl-2-C-methyl-D-erythritol kinase